MVTVLVTILIFMVLITLHEFGHFIVAKAIGVPVLEFSIGMGPAIFKNQGKETLYTIRIFPIGGYCKLEDEDSVSDNPNGFAAQKLWKRFLVVSAGAILNLILGFILFAAVVGITGPFASNVIETIDERSYLAETEVMPGDEIVKINGHKINFYDDIALYTSQFKEGEAFNLTIKRDGSKKEFSLLPSKNEISVKYEETSAVYRDTVNGITKEQVIFYEAEEIPDGYIGKTLEQSRYLIGFSPKMQEVTAANIIPQAYHYTVYVAKSIYMVLGDLVTGKGGLDNVSGPVGVAKVVGDAVNSGKDSVINVLFILAMLSVNLGIFNLLPIPGLDGGRIFFMIIELLRGKPVPPEKEGIVHAIGLLLMLVLAAVIFLNDILKIIT